MSLNQLDRPAAQLSVRSTVMILAIILFLSFAIKLGLRFYLSQSINFWETGYFFYHQMASNLLQTGELYLQKGHSLYEASKLYAIRTPLYPLFIAGISFLSQNSAAALISAQSLISTLTVLLVFLTALEVPLSRNQAIFGALLYAFYPYPLFHDTQLQENVLYNFFSMLSVWTLLIGIRKNQNGFLFVCGMALGAATLTRASHIVPAAALTGFVFYFLSRKRGNAIHVTFVVLTAFVLTLAPWLIRNQRVLGSPVLTSLTGGALSEAHNPYTFLYYPFRGSIDQSTGYYRTKLNQEHDQLPAGEMAQNKWHRKRAMAYILAHKMDVLRGGILKMAVNFLGILSPLQTPAKNWIYFLSYWILTLLMLRALPDLLHTLFFKVFLILCGSQALVSFIFWAHTSHRSFLDPLLAIGAGVGLAKIMESKKVT
ncbi:MAG: glycosyltransferase family 39 protein [Candidatus Omnitrophica bacterium]|nr:glycosyltransferase family 39 protein [Candidatus Omnitrophota bacterium]